MQRILSKIPWFRTYAENRLLKESEFYEQNRKTVLTTYRHLLKHITKIYPRALQQAQKLNELRWIFKQSKQLPNLYQTKGRTDLSVKILNQIKRGDYSSLGDLISHRHKRIYTTTEKLISENSPKKFWWRGHIY